MTSPDCRNLRGPKGVSEYGRTFLDMSSDKGVKILVAWVFIFQPLQEHSFFAERHLCVAKKVINDSWAINSRLYVVKMFTRQFEISKYLEDEVRILSDENIHLLSNYETLSGIFFQFRKKECKLLLAWKKIPSYYLKWTYFQV